MNIIVAIDKKYGIGRDGNLLFHIKDDLKRFKDITSNKTVIMGRKTLESLPGGKPLKNRLNIVLTKNSSYSRDDCKVFNSIYELINFLETEHIISQSFVIGGGEIYKELLPYCDTIYMTEIDADGEANIFFPHLDENVWKFCEDESSEYFFDDENQVKYRYVIYRKR